MRMNRKWQLAGLLLALVACAAALKLDVNNPVLNGHIEKLRAANSVSATFTVNRIGNDLEDHKLVLSKPNLLRWESPTSLIVANGANIVTLDKKSNQYTEEPQSAESLRKLLSNDVIWAWSSLLDEAFLKPVTDARSGNRFASSATVGPNPLGYCSVAATGMPRIFAASIKKAMLRVIISAGGILTINFS